MLLNQFLLYRFKKRNRSVQNFSTKPLETQFKVLKSLLFKSMNTEWGIKYAYRDLLNEDTSDTLINKFQETVPISSYDDLKPWIQKTQELKRGVLWPSSIKYFAKSSGTSSDRSKIVPVSLEALKDCHYKGGQDILSFYTKANPKHKLFKGVSISIGGSFDSSYSNIYCGDLSAILYQNLPLWAKVFRGPSKNVALLNDWEYKMDLIVNESSSQNIVSISGVPSWILLFIKKSLLKANVKKIHDLWPNLELFIHGGVSFLPYKKEFDALVDSNKINYIEVYNASEGFFAFKDDNNRDDMLLMLDLGIFYEFVNIDNFYTNNYKAVSVGDLELGKVYAVLITTNSGLWRYDIGDTVKITSLNPIRIKIVGRTKHYINVFGEELMVDNADRALEITLSNHNASIKDYTVAPVFMKENNKGKHEWLIEFNKKPEDLDLFARELDINLRSLNSDYDAKRSKNMILENLTIIVARDNLFYDWLKSKNRLSSQSKVPRLCNNREYIDDILLLNEKAF